MWLWTLIVYVTIAGVKCAHYGSFKRDNCRGEDKWGRGLRQYSARLLNIPWGSPRRDVCYKIPAIINGNYFRRATRCVRTASYLWGEFDVADPSCSVDRKWVLREIIDLVGFPFSCDWGNVLSNGCSVPLHDPVSILFKDKFQKACVFHDYCYGSPWNKSHEGKAKCDFRFKELMDQICRDNYACLATSLVYYMAVKGLGGDSFDQMQDQILSGTIRCKSKNYYSFS